MKFDIRKVRLLVLLDIFLNIFLHIVIFIIQKKYFLSQPGCHLYLLEGSKLLEMLWNMGLLQAMQYASPQAIWNLLFGTKSPPFGKSEGLNC